jgi:hypothetical protein
MDTPYYSAKVEHLKNGIVKFPPNVQGIYIDDHPSGKTLTVRHNDIRLSFVLEDDDCRHLAALLIGNPAL